MLQRARIGWRPVILGTLLATLALVVWGMLFWGLLYAPLQVFKPQGVDPAVAEALTATEMPSGTYFFPWPRDTKDATARWREAHIEGPFFKLSYLREGADPQSPAKLLIGVLHNLAVAACAAALLVLAAGGPTRYGTRAAIVLVAGAMGSLLIQAGDPIWFHLPWDYAGGALVYEAVSWILLALILAAFVKPSPDPAS